MQITDTAFSRAKTEGMATKDVVGNQSGAPADDSMGAYPSSGKTGQAARAAISAPSEREGYGVALTGGMQERAVRAEKSGSPEPAQKSRRESAAATGGAKRTPITARMEADAIAVANKEIARQSEYDVQQELESIQQNGRGYDVEKLIAENPKYWDAENEELTRKATRSLIAVTSKSPATTSASGMRHRLLTLTMFTSLRRRMPLNHWPKTLAHRCMATGHSVRADISR